HMHSFEYLFVGIEGHGKLVPLMWTSVILAAVSLFLLIPPGFRKNESILVLACITVFISLWIDKGFGLVIGGFIPNHFGTVTEYWPTIPETLITLGIWSIGFLVLTILYKVTVSVREELGTAKSEY
ncbi:MAG: menaquinol oxidoreductase, partial [Thermodesulfovibrionia bacterium]|nr:menaquinol oxidoreductase [Thermodesulfovibrionia bacterium]